MARSERTKAITIGVIIGFLPTIGLAWAFATTAADHVIGPHLSDAKQRVHVMCEWAKVQNANTEAICAATGALGCKTLDAQVLVAAGCYEDGK